MPPSLRHPRRPAAPDRNQTQSTRAARTWHWQRRSLSPTRWQSPPARLRSAARCLAAGDLARGSSGNLDMSHDDADALEFDGDLDRHRPNTQHQILLTDPERRYRPLRLPLMPGVHESQTEILDVIDQLALDRYHCERRIEIRCVGAHQRTVLHGIADALKFRARQPGRVGPSAACETDHR